MHHCLSNVIRYGTVEELAKKLEEKPKQMLIVPQFRPKVARGPFVSKNEQLHHAAHMDVEGTGKATYSIHRHDAKMGEHGEDQLW